MRDVERKIALTIGTVLVIGAANFGIDQGSKVPGAEANGPGVIPTSTPVPTPDVIATVGPILTRIAQTPTRPEQPPVIVVPVPAPQPDKPPIIIIPPQPAPQPQPAPRTDVITIRPEVVDPKVVVCEPKIVEQKVPFMVEVQVTPGADAGYVRLRNQEYNNLLENIKENEKKAEEAKRVLETFRLQCEADKANVRDRTAEQVRAEIAARKSFWDAPWGPIIAGLIGLGIGALAFTRERVVDRVYHHYHP